MSMHTYLINIINDVDDQNTRMKQIEADAIINNETVLGLTTSKQNVITVLTPVVCNTMTCSDVKINNVWMKQDIASIKSSLTSTNTYVTNLIKVFDDQSIMTQIKQTH